jgi:hypothetical protein
MTLSPFLSEHEHCHNCRPPAEHTHQNDWGREISPTPVVLGSLYDWIPSFSSRCYISPTLTSFRHRPRILGREAEKAGVSCLQ